MKGCRAVRRECEDAKERRARRDRGKRTGMSFFRWISSRPSLLRVFAFSIPCAACSLAGIRADALLSAAMPGAAPLRRVQTIPLPGPAGRLDHLALDAVHHRLFVANMPNSSLDVVDLEKGKRTAQV